MFKWNCDLGSFDCIEDKIRVDNHMHGTFLAFSLIGASPGDSDLSINVYVSYLRYPIGCTVSSLSYAMSLFL